MSRNKKSKSLIPHAVSKGDKTPRYLNKTISIMQGWKTGGAHANVFISLRFIQESYQCFSEWTQPEMSLFWDFNRRIHEVTWDSLMKQGGKSDKSGFAPTIIESAKYSNSGFIATLDPLTTFFELRVSGKIRVHGFRDDSVFYICWLDRNHQVCPM